MSIQDEKLLSRRQLVEEAISGLGGLDIVVSNAGRQHSVPNFLTYRPNSSTGR